MARVLTIDEVKQLPVNSMQWMEFNMKTANGKGLFYQYFLRGHMGKDRIPEYNREWRVWDKRPSRLERSNAKWNGLPIS